VGGEEGVGDRVVGEGEIVEALGVSGSVSWVLCCLQVRLLFEVDWGGLGMWRGSTYGGRNGW